MTDTLTRAHVVPRWTITHSRHLRGTFVFSLAWMNHGGGDRSYTIGLGKHSWHYARRMREASL